MGAVGLLCGDRSLALAASYTFTGAITSVGGDASRVDSPLAALAAGDSFVGQFNYGFDAPLTGVGPGGNIYDPHVLGHLWIDYSVIFNGMTVSGGSTTYTYAQVNDRPTGDQFSIHDLIPNSTLVHQPDEVALILSFAPQAFNGVSLPPVLDVQKLVGGALLLDFLYAHQPGSSECCYQVKTVVNSLQPVPEPAIASLIVVGLIATRVMRRRRS